jgi:UDP-N-acetylglucosamine 2-epimerase (non-hydrolysing)
MIAIILGTRPEIIKMSPIIRSCEKRGVDHVVLHTGQHYSYDMDKVFFEELGLPQPDYNLDVGSKSHAEQTGAIMSGVEKVLMDIKPDIVLVQGDTNTVLAGTLAAAKCYVRGDHSLPVKIGHVEAGLRSFDRKMPEEVNRVVADHLSDYCFAPTGVARKNLLDEGIADNTIFITGNTIVDAVHENLALSDKKVKIIDELGISENNYFLVTLHRQENVDDKKRLTGILKALKSIHESSGLPIIFPVHPRTEKMIDSFGLRTSGIRTLKPLGFLEFLQLESKALLVLTDSGGVQEETCILGVPCVTIRDSTERPETVAVHANSVAGASHLSIVNAVETMLNRPRSWDNPFGDGKSGDRIVSILCR